MSNSHTPAKITLLAYNVGFGDCLLLRFHYHDGPRHVLIDFGTTSKPARAGKNYMTKIAESVREECGGKLDALVATHRHADHISGFSVEDGPGEIIAACHPGLVVRPWTEDPDAASDATGPTAAFLGAATGLRDEALMRGRQFVGRLNDAGRFSAAIAAAARAGRPARTGLRAELAFLAAVNSLPNQSAVDNLNQMAQAADNPPRYVYYGADSGLEQVLPGVKIRVLGPPTVDQTPSIRRPAEEDHEFWLLARLAEEYFSATAGAEAAPAGMADRLPPYARWLKRRLESLHLRELLEIVRQLDDVLNNTSVILLFEVGPAKLLFSGDAQIENWRYALEQPGVLDTLRDVALYKVGHHGSRNATPKTLWNVFARKAESGDDRLITVLSTKHGKHGEENEGTEVPRQTLVEALERYSRCYSTERLKLQQLYEKIEIGL